MSATVRPVGAFERHLRAARDGGRKLLVPYVTGGLDEQWTDVVAAHPAVALADGRSAFLVEDLLALAAMIRERGSTGL